MSSQGEFGFPGSCEPSDGAGTTGADASSRYPGDVSRTPRGDASGRARGDASRYRILEASELLLPGLDEERILYTTGPGPWKPVDGVYRTPDGGIGSEFVPTTVADRRARYVAGGVRVVIEYRRPVAPVPRRHVDPAETTARLDALLTGAPDERGHVHRFVWSEELLANLCRCGVWFDPATGGSGKRGAGGA